MRPQTEILNDRVRKVAHTGSGTIQAFLRHLQSTGIDYVPTPLRLFDHMEEISYLPGVCYGPVEPRPSKAWDVERLVHLGTAVRRCHDSSVEVLASWPDAEWFPFAEACDAPEVICHNDLGPWNVAIDGEHINIIDWEMAAPGKRIWDIAHIAWNWVPYFPYEERARVKFPEPYHPEARLAALLKGYGANHWTTEEVLEEVLRRQSRTLELSALSFSTGAMLLENWGKVETDPILADQAFVRECISKTV